MEFPDSREENGRNENPTDSAENGKQVRPGKGNADKKAEDWHSPLSDDDEAEDLLGGAEEDRDTDWHSPLADDDEADDLNSDP